jgi:Na+-transporting methylmalonyl-CoA/oxaloacetate decarboxylase gamma subunit
MMTSALSLGLRLSLIGLSVTFLALGLVIMVMELLVRIFPQRQTSNEPESAGGMQNAEEQTREEMAVALAVGVALLEDQEQLEARDPTLGKLLES